MWCWEGGPRWFYTADVPVPAHRLALWAGSRVKCASCSGQSFALDWQTFANGTLHLRARCTACGAARYLKPPPGNPDVEYRASG